MFNPSIVGTIFIVIACMISYSNIKPSQLPSEIAQNVSITVLVGILISIYLDFKSGIRNIFRADLFCLVVLFGLTLFEFLFDQKAFNNRVSVEQTISGIEIVLLGISVFVIARHFVSGSVKTIKFEIESISTKTLFNVLLISFILAYFYRFLSVNFNLFNFVLESMGARFSQSWSRGKFGGVSVFLSELWLFSYIIPPISALLIHKKKELTGIQLLIVYFTLLITLFSGFASGTRNLFFTYVAGYGATYLLLLNKITFRNFVLPALIVGWLSFNAINYMVEFRSRGLLNYLNNPESTGFFNSSLDDETPVFVDYNLYVIGSLSDVFPERVPYIGWDLYYNALVRPIPRVLFPGKPEGLKVGIEESLGVGGYTLAATYLGEAYISGGYFAVIVCSIVFGYLSAWWTKKMVVSESKYSILIFALGLFAAGITMRSMLEFTTAVLPIIGLSVLLKYQKA